MTHSAENDALAEAARTLLDALRANWSALPGNALSGPMRQLDDALGNPPARNFPPAEKGRADA